MRSALRLGDIGLAVVVASAVAWIGVRFDAALLIVGIGGAAIATTAFVRPRPALVFVAVFTPLVAGLRRFVEFELGEPTAGDALLAVSPLITLAVAAAAVRHGAMRERTRVGTLVLIVLTVAVAGVLNPEQGSLLVGLAGFMYFGTPLLWYFSARAFADDALMRRVLRAAMWTTLFVGAYTLYQWSGRFPSWDEAYLDNVDFGILVVEKQARPLATLASPDEAGRYLGIGVVLFASLIGLRGRSLFQKLLVSVIVPTLLFAVVVTGVRSALVLLGLAAGLRIAVARRGHALVAVASALLLLFAAIGAARVVGGGSSNPFIERNLAGLADPLDSNDSTLDRHFASSVSAFDSVTEHPVGRGTGVTTPAATAFGGRPITGETDLGDAALSWGLPGLLGYGLLMITAGLRAYDVARRRADRLAMAAIGVLALGFVQWLNGGLYAIAPLCWMLFGWLDRDGAPPTGRAVEAGEHSDQLVAGTT